MPSTSIAPTSTPGRQTMPNPMGLNGFEFVEFTHDDPDALARLFTSLGFTHIGTHRSKNVRHYRQGDINFILNMEPVGQAANFRQDHGPSANAMAFRVQDAARALAIAVERGAVPVSGKVGPAELNIPAIEGIGGANLYLVDRRGAATIYDIDFEPVPGADADANSVGLHSLDHLTHNLRRGHMDKWAHYYESIFDFREIRYFDIEGQSTGLFSKAMTAPDEKIRIPLNESQDEHSQIIRGKGFSISRSPPMIFLRPLMPCAPMAWCSRIRRIPIMRGWIPGCPAMAMISLRCRHGTS
jgi:4-hydroxyphenylpyruvate dioxygenase